MGGWEGGVCAKVLGLKAEGTLEKRQRSSSAERRKAVGAVSVSTGQVQEGVAHAHPRHVAETEEPCPGA